ncbi:MAG: glycosyltransferase [Muribaculaceae bacterium]|nr:glycosyltransferase [Muribaculaceae bacterium]
MKQTNKAKKRVLAVASIGGHWVQLLRITAGLADDYDFSYCSTHARCAVMVPGRPFHTVADFSRWDAWRMPAQLMRLVRIIRRERPDVVLTTGAAPGLTAILAARICGVRTIWVDSVANVEHLSASGRIATRLAHRVFTQWPHLADGHTVAYAGNVF